MPGPSASAQLNDVTGSGGIVTNNNAAAGTLNITGGGGSFSGTLQNGTGILNLAKSGTGTQTLTGGASTFTGSTTVSGGTLALAGSANLSTSPLITVSGSGTLDVSALGGAFSVGAGQSMVNNAVVAGGVSVNTGATIKGTGTFNSGGLTLSGGTIAPGNSGVGSMSMSGLTVNSGNLSLDFSAGNISDLISVAGSATFNGASSILPTAITPPSGTYTILTSTGLSGTAPTAPTTTRSTYVVHFGDGISGANKIAVQITAVAPKTIFWKGNDPNDNTAWDALGAAGHVNWTDSSISEKYFDFDTVVFDDVHSPSNRNVVLNAAVTPTAVTVDNSTAPYTISGGGSINGATGLTKRGTNVLNLSTSNNYTGPTNIENGTLVMGNSNALPTNTALTLGAGSTSGTLDLNGSTVTFSTLATAGTGATNTIGSSSQSSTSTINYAGGTSVFGGVIKDTLGTGTQNISLNVNTGSLTLAGNSTYTGPTMIATGATLQLGSGGTSGGISATTSITDNGVLAINKSTNLTLGDINGTGNIQQLGTGTTILAGNDVYVGTVINAGTLQIGNGGTTGALGSGAVTTTGGTLAFNRSDAVTVANVISGAAGVTQNSPTTGVVTLSGTNTYTGPTTISGGTLMMGGAAFAALGTGGSVTISNGGTLDLGGITANNVANGFGARQIFVSGTGVGGGLGAIANSSATVAQQNAFQNVTLTGNATIGNPGSPTVANSPGRFDIRGGVALLNLNGNTLTKIGTNQFTLVGVTVNDGNIVVASPDIGATRNIMSFENHDQYPGRG